MRSRGSRDVLNYKSPAAPVKDSSIGNFHLILLLVVFSVAGVVIGLLAANFHVDQHIFLQAKRFYRKEALAAEVHYSSNSCPTFVEKCEKEDYSSIESFVMPKILSHKMTDEELFWRATLMPLKVEYPYIRKPKVAFMFLTRGPLPLLPLWERFFEGQSEELFSIYVHALPWYQLNVSDVSAFYGRQIPSQKVKWGTASLAQAERRLLANALLDFSNERFVLLSESCIPVYNFPTVYKYLIGSEHSFVQSYDDPSRYGRGRYSRRMQPHILLRDWRKGSQWFELHRAIAVRVVSDTKFYNLFSKYCTPDCYPDEHYLPTFIHMLYGSLNSNRTVTYVDWSLGGPHPATFTADNVTESFIGFIRSNGNLCSYNGNRTPICYLFARKFSPNALERLLNLTSTVMEFREL